MRTSGHGARRAAAGLALGAAGMLYSRLGGRRADRRYEPEPEPQRPPEPEPERDPDGGAPSPDDLKRARSELSEELARRAARADS